MPAIVTENGDIQIHGQEGAVLALRFQQEDGTPRDMTGAVIKLAIEGFEKNLTPGVDPDVMVLTLARGELPDTIGKVVEFVVTDETGSIPHVIWGGRLIQTGWR